MVLQADACKRIPHIAIFNCAEHGHVNPTLGMVKELTARGYRVSYTTSAEFAPLVSACGAIPVIFEPIFSKETPRPEDMGHVVVELAKEASHTWQPLYNAFNDDRPDIIAYGPLSWLGKIFAKLWGIPSVALNPTHVSYQGQSEEWLGVNADKWPCLAILQNMLQRNGQNLDIQTLLADHDNILAFIPRSFQEKAETVPCQTLFVGPHIMPRPSAVRWIKPDKERPVIAISLGSVYTDQPNFFRACISAFAESEYRVIISLGRYVSLEALGVLPDNVDVYASIPQLEVLAIADLFITHAGMNSVMEAAHFGVPLIAVPQQAEQRLNAQRIEQLGLGRYLRREEVNADTLMNAAREVLATPAIQENLALFQQQIRQAGGARAAADLFDRILASRNPGLAAAS